MEKVLLKAYLRVGQAQIISFPPYHSNKAKVFKYSPHG
jgi:hypothetical protein